jgi:hypothetical protein
MNAAYYQSMDNNIFAAGASSPDPDQSNIIPTTAEVTEETATSNDSIRNTLESTKETEIQNNLKTPQAVDLLDDSVDTSTTKQYQNIPTQKQGIGPTRSEVDDLD